MTNLNNKASWTEVNEMLSNKIDKEAVTNALHKKVNKNDLSVLEQDLTTKIQKTEESFKAKLDQILEAQEHLMQIVENETVIKEKDTPQIVDLQNQIYTKVDRREFDTYTKNIELSISRPLNKLREEFTGHLQAITSTIEHYKSNTGKYFMLIFRIWHRSYSSDVIDPNKSE